MRKENSTLLNDRLRTIDIDSQTVGPIETHCKGLLIGNFKSIGLIKHLKTKDNIHQGLNLILI